MCVIVTDDVPPRNMSSVLHPDTNTYLHDALNYWPFNETYHLSKFEDFDHTHFDGKLYPLYIFLCHNFLNEHISVPFYSCKFIFSLLKKHKLSAYILLYFTIKKVRHLTYVNEHRILNRNKVSSSRYMDFSVK